MEMIDIMLLITNFSGLGVKVIYVTFIYVKEIPINPYVIVLFL